MAAQARGQGGGGGGSGSQYGKEQALAQQRAAAEKKRAEEEAARKAAAEAEANKPPPVVEAPSAGDVANDQMDQIAQTKRMAQAQGAPNSDAEGGAAEGEEKASTKRRSQKTGKRGLSIRRSSGSGLSI